MKRILVIDADASILDLLRPCITRVQPDACLDVYQPSRGVPAPEFCHDQYDLMLLEYQLDLPDQTGLDWLREFKRRPLYPPIVMVTAHGDESIAVQALKQGADDYISKDDLSPRRVATCLQELMKKSVAREQRMPEKKPFSGMQPNDNPRDREAAGRSGRPASYNEPTARPAPERQDPSQKQTQNHEIGVPGYRVIRPIGSGGMATIYLVERDADGLQLILKILPIKEEDNQDLLKRFMREYSLLSKLSHPYVARVFERGFAHDLAYIAMEYFPAGDLKARLNNDITPTLALLYLRQMTLGLGAVHRINVVHRDLKPANILFRNDNSLAIADFGIAKDTRDDASITAPRALLGTAYYLCPEMVSGGTIDHRSDLYSLGIILYQMLTGVQPYRGSSAPEVFQAHLSSPIPRLSGQLSAYQPLIDGLLSKDPDDRFQSTDEMIAGLDWIEGR